MTAIAEFNGTAHPQIDLDVRRAAHLIQRCLHPIHHGAISRGCSEREWPRAFGLRQGRNFEAAGSMKHSPENKAVANVFARRAVISRAKWVQRIANSVHVIE